MNKNGVVFLFEITSLILEIFKDVETNHIGILKGISK